jgi:RimJ/RimL family protein N-acetyltransferase
MEISSKGFNVALRTLRLGDASEIAKQANDPEIARNVARLGDFPFPYTEECALSFIASASEAERAGSSMHFGIIHRGKAVGACALLNMDSGRSSCELGYWLGREYWGKGYATEALRLLLKFAFGRAGIKEAIARTFAANSRSTRLLSSLGFSAGAGPEANGEMTYRLSSKAYADGTEIKISQVA